MAGFLAGRSLSWLHGGRARGEEGALEAFDEDDILKIQSKMDHQSHELPIAKSAEILCDFQ